ncbi:hypothetical protein [Geodermatophilus sp. SYSU D01176]
MDPYRWAETDDRLHQRDGQAGARVAVRCAATREDAAGIPHGLLQTVARLRATDPDVRRRLGPGGTG